MPAQRGKLGEGIRIYGARQHNLANLELELPRGAFVVVSGPSGSGKTSLVFGTLYAESRRRYMASLSAASRSFFESLERPEVDRVEGLPPAIALTSRSEIPHPRSTVGTTSGIYDLLRVLFARLAQAVCMDCGSAMRAWTVQEIVAEALVRPRSRRLLICAPLALQEGESRAQRLIQLRESGFARVRIDGHQILLEELSVEALNPRFSPQGSAESSLPQSLQFSAQAQLELIVDRLVIHSAPHRPSSQEESPRDADLVARFSESVELAMRFGDGAVYLIWIDETGAEELERRHDSPRCADCARVYPGPQPGLFSFNTAAGACPTCAGLGELRTECSGASSRTKPSTQGATARRRAQRNAHLMQPCPDCAGQRLNQIALHFLLQGKSLGALAQTPLEALEDWLRGLTWSGAEAVVAEQAVSEIHSKLTLLCEVGLGGLRLHQALGQLSSGERRRVLLAAQPDAGLSGMLYVLDEPSIGLHPRDLQRLLKVLRALRDQGNTVLVVEHDADLIAAADHVIQLGPGAGAEGGRIIAQGPPQVLAAAASTAPAALRRRKPTGKLIVREAQARNLREARIELPLGILLGLSGVSGSGKSGLLQDVLYPSVQRILRKESLAGLPLKTLEGAEGLQRVVWVDSRPLSASARVIAASYAGVWSEIRKQFAVLPAARLRGYGAERFSFNRPGGRCEACRGEGLRRVEMHFLPDVRVRCTLCGGARYNEQTLAVRYRGRSIGELLEMSIGEANTFFSAIPAIRRRTEAVIALGLAYLRLGQPGDALSGGEVQRLKLARELLRRDGAGTTLYLLDEPTRGLHSAEKMRLLDVLHRLVGQGHSVFVIEHDLEFLWNTDFMLDLGPEGGAEGGRVVGQGTPETWLNEPSRSHTAFHLAAWREQGYNLI